MKKQKLSFRELQEIAKTLSVGDQIAVTWSSSAVPTPNIWKGTVKSRNEDGSVNVQYSEPELYLFPPHEDFATVHDFSLMTPHERLPPREITPQIPAAVEEDLRRMDKGQLWSVSHRNHDCGDRYLTTSTAPRHTRYLTSPASRLCCDEPVVDEAWPAPLYWLDNSKLKPCTYFKQQISLLRRFRKIMKQNLVTNDVPQYVAREDAGVEAEDLGIRANILAPKAEASVNTTIINIICNIVGGGVLAMPEALRNTSLFPGVITILLVAVASGFSMLILTIVAEKTQKFTYKDLLTVAFSPRAGRAFEVILFFYTFGVLVGYARIVADSIPSVMINFLHASGVWIQPWFWLLLGGVIFFPLSSMKQLSELKWSSYLGFATIAYIGFMIVIRFFMGTYREPNQTSLISGDVPLLSFTSGFIQALPVVSVGFSCHYNIPAFYHELENRTPSRMFRSLTTALPIITTFYLIVGVFGLLMFGGSRLTEGQGDILQNFGTTDVPFNVGRLGMFFHFVCVYPIICIACRRALNGFLFNESVQRQRTYIIEAFFLVLFSCILAYLVKNIAIVFEINGALFGLTIVIVLPSLFYVRIFRLKEEVTVLSETELQEDSSPQQGYAELEREPSRLQNLVLRHNPVVYNICRVMAVVGIVLSIVCFSVTVWRVANGIN